MMKHHSALGGTALALALALTACTDDGTDPNPQDPATATPSTPSAAPTTAPPSQTTREEKATAALQRYLKFRDDAYRAGEPVDTKRLNRLATGSEFLELQQALVEMISSGIAVSGDYVHTLDDPRDRGSKITISDCEDRSGVTRKKDGKVVDQSGDQDPEGNPLANPLPVQYRLVKHNGDWLVTESDILWDQKC